MLHSSSLRATFAFTLVSCLFLGGAARAEGLFVPIIDKRVVAHVMPPAPPPNNPNFITRPPRPSPAYLPFRITSSKVDVRIDDNVATTSIEQSFLNLSGRDLEVKMLYPMPSGAAINNSALSFEGQMVEGKLYSAEEAMRIYQSIVNARRDPALLRYAGESLYEASIFPVPPNQERKLKFSYTQELKATAGIYDYKHALSTTSQYADGIGNYDLTCTIRSKNGIGPVYSSSHDVEIDRRDANTAVVRLRGAKFSSENDLRLYYALEKGEAVFRMIAHRVAENEDGYFMLIGRADEPLKGAPMPSKEIVFVVDRSGSMQGPKIQQTRNALKFCLNSLSERDRFNLITFSTDVEGLSPSDLLQATPENIKKALAAVDQIEATGGTNIDSALRAALGSNFSKGAAAAKMVVFMTDGLPTNGVTDMAEIIRGVKATNTEKVRVFNFGVGDDVNTHLLDQLAGNHEGTSSYVSPREDIEIKISDFWGKVKNPVMTEVAFDYGTSSGVSSVYPRKLPALFKGGEFVLMGRYKGSGPGEIVLSGRVGEETKRIVMKVDWPYRTLDNSYLPRVWAMRKIGFLLEEIRIHGSNQEIIKEIVELSTRHGIVTPYTSQLVLEPGMVANANIPALRAEIERRNRDGRGGFGFNGGGGIKADELAGILDPAKAAAAPRPAGERMVEALADKKKAEESLLRAVPAVAAASNAAQSGDASTSAANWEKELQSAYNGATNNMGLNAGKNRAAGEQLAQSARAMKLSRAFATNANLDDDGKLMDCLQQALIRNVGARTFYNRAGVWVDSQAAAQKKVVVKQYSDDYYNLLKKDNEMGQVLALGNNVLVCSGDTLYQVEE